MGLARIMCRWKFNSVLYRWMRSFFLVLLIPIVLMTIAYYQTNHVMEKETNRANLALIGQLRQELDHQIQYVQQLSQVIALNSRVNSLNHIGTDPDTEQRLNMVKALADFRDYGSVNPMIERFYVYYHKSGSVLNKDAIYENAVFYDIHLQPSGIRYPLWKQTMEESYRGRFISLQAAAAVDGVRNRIMFAQSLPLEDPNHAVATLIVELNESRLLEAMNAMNLYDAGIVSIIDDSSQVLISTEALPSGHTAAALERMMASSGILDDTVDGKRVKIAYISSELLNWKYVYTLPAKIYREKVEYVRNLAIISVLISLLIGVVTSLLLSRRNYQPLKLLIDLLSVKGKRTYQSAQNEYDFIEKTIASTLDERNQIYRKMEEQQHTLRENFLQRLLKGRIEDNFPLADTLQAYHIVFDHDNFAVILLYLEDYSGLFEERENDFEKKLKLVILIVRNIMEEMVGRQFGGYVAEADGMLACIVNMEVGGGENKAALLEKLQGIAIEAQQFIKRRFYIQFSLSISGIHQTYKGIAAAYQESLEAMEYRMLLGTQSIITYEQIRVKDDSYPYSSEQEQQLIHAIKSGDLSRSSVVLDTLIDRCIMDGNLSIEMARCLIFDIIGTMMKASIESLSVQPELYADNQRVIQGILACKTVAEMRGQMAVFLKLVCGHLESLKKSHNKQLRDGVIAFIQHHYADSNLSLQGIADQFQVSPSYLSRYFKEQTGDTLSDYISRYRIGAAKRLLAEAGVPAKQVASMTGFHSINTFIRLFKKYEGVTPGVYRDLHKH
ncbi:AraC family transcriptional regulator [Paenibacillaceae bacterium]|nr:AraC family transcriptional regulator [Paenibacillaceae bacterium]